VAVVVRSSDSTTGPRMVRQIEVFSDEIRNAIIISIDIIGVGGIKLRFSQTKRRGKEYLS
jgi:hypothetical protein